MNQWTHRCMIVPAKYAEFARALPVAIAGASGAGMWATPLSPTGTEPATHYISVGLIDMQFAALMPLTQYPAEAEPIHTPGRAAIAAQLATEAGLPTTYEQVTELFDACDCSEQEPQEAMARLKLMLVSEAME